MRQKQNGINCNLHISTHAPLARCDPEQAAVVRMIYISTPAPLARCDGRYMHRLIRQQISTHAPLARCDARATWWTRRWKIFQLTHLLRGATRIAREIETSARISTHAPLARCDRYPRSDRCGDSHFNSRTSCEVRHRRVRRRQRDHRRISTHAPLARCDWRPGRDG